MEATARRIVDRPIEEAWTHVSTAENAFARVVGVSDVRRTVSRWLSVKLDLLARKPNRTPA